MHLLEVLHEQNAIAMTYRNNGNLSVGHIDVIAQCKDASLVTALKLPEKECSDRSPQEDTAHVCWKVIP